LQSPFFETKHTASLTSDLSGYLGRTVFALKRVAPVPGCLALAASPPALDQGAAVGRIRKRGNWVYRTARCCLITAGRSLKDLRGSSWKALDD